jgi:MFS family permease
LPSSPQSNLVKYLIGAILRGAAVSTSIVLWIVFLQKQYGFTLTEVVLLDIPFWVGKFLFEIPTGVVADKFGRRLSLMIAAAMSSACWLVFALSGSFWVLMVTQFIGAIGATFQSGADEALLFETVRAAGREKEYARISARMGVAGTVSAMVCGLGVGVLAETSLRLPVFLSSLVFALAIVPILLMSEEPRQRLSPDSGAAHLSGYTQIVKTAISALRATPILRWAAAYLVILSCVSFYANTFLQPYTLSLGLTIALLGPILVAVQLSGIAGSLSVQRVEAIFGTRTLLAAVPILLIPCMLVIGLVRLVPVLSIVALASFLFTITQPVLLAVIQGKISDDARATLLSIQSLLATVFLIFTEPALGLVADRFGVHTTYLVMAALLAAFCLPLLWSGRRMLASE